MIPRYPLQKNLHTVDFIHSFLLHLFPTKNVSQRKAGSKISLTLQQNGAAISSNKRVAEQHTAANLNQLLGQVNNSMLSPSACSWWLPPKPRGAAGTLFSRHDVINNTQWRILAFPSFCYRHIDTTVRCFQRAKLNI